MEKTPVKRFKNLARSLALYGRHSVKSLGVSDINLLDDIYIDPLPDNGAVEKILNKKFTALIGRKGTGKSILFNVCQQKVLSEKDSIGVYINCHQVLKEESYDLVAQFEKYNSGLSEYMTPKEIESYLLRRTFIEKMLIDLISEVNKKISKSWAEKLKKAINASKLEEIKKEFESIKKEVLRPSDVEIKLVKEKHLERKKEQQKIKSKTTNISAGVDVNANLVTAEAKGDLGLSGDFNSEKSEDESVLDFQDYSSIFISLFRPRDIIRKIFKILHGVGISKLYIFADDYSEMPHEYQGVLSNSILAQYHQMTEEQIYISIAGYPNRFFLGNEVDQSKVVPLRIDFEEIYKKQKINQKHSLGEEFVKNLIEKRMKVYCPNDSFSDFFSLKEAEVYKVLFQASYLCPRIIGEILEDAIEMDLASGKKLGLSVLKTSAEKYYEDRIKSFLRQSKYSIREADVPFYTPIEVHSQLGLLEKISEELKELQTRIYATKTYEPIYGKNPPVSHFHIKPKYADLIKFLTNNYLLNKVDTLQVKKDKITADVYALNLGICSKKSIKYWEPIENRDARNYLIERFFYFDDVVESFLGEQKEIVCMECKSVYPIEDLKVFEKFHMTCTNPECGKQACEVREIQFEDVSADLAVSEELKLPKADIEILEALKRYQKEEEPLFPKEIAGFVDKSYQFVTSRMIKLSASNFGLVEILEDNSGRRVYQISNKAVGTYF